MCMTYEWVIQHFYYFSLFFFVFEPQCHEQSSKLRFDYGGAPLRHILVCELMR